jgi:cardiolipin synthase
LIETGNLTSFKLFDEPLMYLEAMLEDIGNAGKFIYLEIYKFSSDDIGMRFRDALIKKASEGLKIKLLIDSWGALFNDTFFEDFVKHGGEIRLFRKIKLSFDFFTKNHRRNHRKMLIIDDHIAYIGSANITGYSLQWRESVLRMTGGIAEVFKKSFLESFKSYNKYIYNKFSYKKTIIYKEFELVQDIPSIYRQQIKNKLERLISNAKYEVIIETPYFLPGYKLRKVLAQASFRGVKVTVILPQHSDVRAVDLLRNKYMGFYYENDIRMMFYTLGNLHAKAILIDNEIFGLGSPNVDYRSFRYMYEVMLFGKNAGVVSEVKQHIENTLQYSVLFDHKTWMRRPRIEKILGWILLPFRHLF